MRTLLALGLISALGCSGGAPHGATLGEPAEARAPSKGNEPRLVVLLIIDQWPEWAFEAKRPAVTGGFDRVLREGQWHVGQHPSMATLTAVGHSVLGTGEPPYHSGIMANEWWRRDLDRSLRSVEDEDGTATARWLRVPGLGDAVAAGRGHSAGGKAVSVSLKDRAAILPLGHAGTAIWLDKSLHWVSLRNGTDHTPPAWLDSWNTERPVSAHLHDSWLPLPEVPKLAGVPDDNPGEVGDKGLGTTFPHELATTPTPAEALFATPIANDLVFDTATTAIDREQLGADDHPDLLVISLSAHDYIGHSWGQESWESWDAFLKIDRRLARFLDDLDARVGAKRWSMIVTSDHGASPMPESLHGGRLTFAQLKDAANRAAATELGAGDWVASARYPTIYLTKAALARPAKDINAAVAKILLALRSFPGLARVDKTADFAGHCETRPADLQPYCLALDPDRSGDIFYLPAPGWVLQEGDEKVATGHGSMNPYDRLVPVLALEPGRSPHPPLAAPDATLIPTTQISTILARWLGVPPPVTLPRAAQSPPPPVR